MSFAAVPSRTDDFAMIATFFRILGLCALAVAANGVNAAPVRVLATNPVLLDWVQEVGGDLVEAQLLGATGDFHNYDPTPADLRRLAQADLVVSNGAGLEPWLDRLVASSGSQARRLTASTGLPLLPAGATIRLVAGPDQPLPPCCAAENPGGTIPGELSAEVVPPAGGHIHTAECEHGHDGDQDPHLWLDPRLAQGIVTLLGDVLGEIDPDHAETFGTRADAYAARLAALDRWIAAELTAVPTERRVLVTYHHAFAYFAKRYQLALPGSLLGSVHSEAREPGPRAAAAFVAFIRDQQLPAIFGEHGQDDRLLAELGRSAGVPVAWLYAEALPPSEPTYEGLLRHNTREIKRVLVAAPGS